MTDHDQDATPESPTSPFDLRALLATARLGVLATIRSDGRPQLSPVMPFYDRDSDRIYVSTTHTAAKTVNLRRDARAALEVTSPDGWAWATAEGTARLTGPATDPHGAEVEALVDYYRAAAGDHPDWDEYRSVMVTERRVLIAMAVEHVYGATSTDQTGQQERRHEDTRAQLQPTAGRELAPARRGSRGRCPSRRPQRGAPASGRLRRRTAR